MAALPPAQEGQGLGNRGSNAASDLEKRKTSSLILIWNGLCCGHGDPRAGGTLPSLTYFKLLQIFTDTWKQIKDTDRLLSGVPEGSQVRLQMGLSLQGPRVCVAGPGQGCPFRRRGWGNLGTHSPGLWTPASSSTDRKVLGDPRMHKVTSAPGQP